MAPSPADPGVSIFDGLYARGAAAAAVDGQRVARALLEVEAALAQAQADAGAIARERPTPSRRPAGRSSTTPLHWRRAARTSPTRCRPWSRRCANARATPPQPCTSARRARTSSTRRRCWSRCARSPRSALDLDAVVPTCAATARASTATRRCGPNADAAGGPDDLRPRARGLDGGRSTAPASACASSGSRPSSAAPAARGPPSATRAGGRESRSRSGSGWRAAAPWHADRGRWPSSPGHSAGRGRGTVGKPGARRRAAGAGRGGRAAPARIAAAAGRRPWPTSTTRSRRSRRAPARPRRRVSWRRSSRPCRASTNVPRAPGSPSGGRSPS